MADDRVLAVGCCHRCGSPVIRTIAFRGLFYCVNCGARYQSGSPVPVAVTAELLERMYEAERDFDQLAQGMIGDGAALMDCAFCKGRMMGGHIDHATEAEVRDNDLARTRLKMRAAGWRQRQGPSLSGWDTHHGGAPGAQT